MKFSKYNLILPGLASGQFYLFNTFNGSCFEIDENTVDVINSCTVKNLNEETQEAFELSGIIISDDMNEAHNFSYLHGKHKFNTKSFGSTVLLTWDCNLRCPYCFQGLDKSIESTTFEQADRYINFTLGSVVQNDAKSVFMKMDAAHLMTLLAICANLTKEMIQTLSFE